MPSDRQARRREQRRRDNLETKLRRLAALGGGFFAEAVQAVDDVRARRAACVELEADGMLLQSTWPEASIGLPAPMLAAAQLCDIDLR